MNHVVITGELIERSALRYTPAAVAVLDLKLLHSETVDQAGVTRLIKFEIPIVAMGDLALMWQSVTLGQVLNVEGFLAAARQNSPRLVLHAQQIGVSSNV
ncbi:MAG: primosomal replication protein N [Burkholderiaceae bacterium]|nr:primosomal replication protein N [Burkholderiaceae bacterium]MCD8516387.1 primosomal replication protein N [Burkholderiaceae bacterium]MCD8538214.1 primosomal replication protein N [Burkholderiaceae bacterium]MCD8565752.1 primosomal replication protein N [Burkholderiaceae bacterium]